MSSRIYHVAPTGIIHRKGLAPCQSGMEHIERVKDSREQNVNDGKNNNAPLDDLKSRIVNPNQKLTSQYRMMQMAHHRYNLLLDGYMRCSQYIILPYYSSRTI